MLDASRPSTVPADMMGRVSPLSRPSTRASTRARSPFYLRSQSGLEEENRSYRQSRPATMMGKAKKKLFISSPRERTLPRPATPGLLVAGQIADFDTLADRKILDVPDDEKTYLEQKDVNLLYKAKCLDQGCSESFDRATRFHELLCEQCKGQWFVLRQCGLGPQTVKAIVNVLLSNDHYTHLDLSGNNVGQMGAKALGHLLENNDSVCVLRLQSANLGEGTVELMRSLSNNCTLTALDLSGLSGIHRNSIWGQSVQQLGKMLRNNKVLSYLNIADCGLQRGSNTLFRSCIQHNALTYLNVSGNKIRDEGCSAISEFLESTNCDLITLALEDNGITCEGALRIGTSLSSGSATVGAKLKKLYLGFNAIGARGCTAIAGGIREHEHLEVLGLENNPMMAMGVDEDGYRIDDSLDGVNALFLSVDSAVALHTLKMSKCGLVSLPTTFPGSLRRATQLTSLDISENPLKDKSCAILADALNGNSSLTSLNATYCGFTSDGLRILADAISRHQHLKHLKIKQNQFKCVASGMVDAIQRNKSLLTVDIGREENESVYFALRRNTQLLITNAGPQLNEALMSCEERKKTLEHTKGMIIDEQRGREKLTELIKASREKQKALVAQQKNELQELQERFDQAKHVADTAEVKLLNEEDNIAKNQRIMDNNRMALRSQIDMLARANHDTQLSIRELDGAIAEKEKASPLAKKLRRLEKELSALTTEITDSKRTVEMYQTLIADAERRIALLAAPALQGKKGGKKGKK